MKFNFVNYINQHVFNAGEVSKKFQAFIHFRALIVIKKSYNITASYKTYSYSAVYTFHIS